MYASLGLGFSAVHAVYLAVYCSASLPSASACVVCPGGTYLDTSGCAICPVGTYGSSGVCVACPNGYYQPVDGSSACQACAAG